jgi:hypothetical protein
MISTVVSRVVVVVPCVLILILAACGSDIPTVAPTVPSAHRSVTRGLATTTIANIFPGCSNSRIAAVGTIASLDGKTTWTVPAETQFTSDVKATDLYNDCSGVKLTNINLLDLSKVPTVVVDADGISVAAYVFVDNYFEMYVNGKLVGVDPVPYTPFNACVVQFRVKKPYTVAIKVVDWEEHLGVGSEVNAGDSYHAGDGGLIAYFSDGTKTDNSWKAQTFYIAPLADTNAATERTDGTRSTAGVTTTPGCNGSCYALHWPIPADWTSKAFNDAGWPAASVFTSTQVGVEDKPAFTTFRSTWASSSFIWSSNLVLDNVVLLRKTVQ